MEQIQGGTDTKEWAIVFERYREKFKGENPKWFAVSWLFAECYMYRKIVEILHSRYNHYILCRDGLYKEAFLIAYVFGIVYSSID